MSEEKINQELSDDELKDVAGGGMHQGAMNSLKDAAGNTRKGKRSVKDTLPPVISADLSSGNYTDRGAT